MTNAASPLFVVSGGLAGVDDDGPTVAELEAIEAEWPLIAAELALVEAEVRAAGDPESAIAVAAVTAARLCVAAVEESYQSIHFLEVS